MSTGTGSNRSGAAGSVAAAATTAAPAEEEEEEELEEAELEDEDEDEDEEEDEEVGNPPVRAFFGGRGMPSGGGDVGGAVNRPSGRRACGRQTVGWSGTRRSAGRPWRGGWQGRPCALGDARGGSLNVRRLRQCREVSRGLARGGAARRGVASVRRGVASVRRGVASVRRGVASVRRGVASVRLGAARGARGGCGGKIEMQHHS
jgi:hypothetical protein